MKIYTVLKRIVLVVILALLFSGCGPVTSYPTTEEPAPVATEEPAPVATEEPARNPAFELPVPGMIVPLPEGEEQQMAKTELEAAMDEAGIDGGQYDTGAVGIYPGPNAQEAQFSSAPINQGFSEFPYGEPILVLYDRQDTYGNGKVVYQVSFSDNNQAVLTSPSISEPYFLEASYKEQVEGLETTSAFFVDDETQAALPLFINFPSSGLASPLLNPGTCYLCGCCDGICGCLFCTR